MEAELRRKAYSLLKFACKILGIVLNIFGWPGLHGHKGTARLRLELATHFPLLSIAEVKILPPVANWLSEQYGLE